MILLDENIPESQRQLLRGWRIQVRQIGYEVGRKGMKDDEIIPFLLQHPRPTFFTLDEDFYERSLCHADYCLASLAVGSNEAATFVRRFLRHPSFNTAARRMGSVVRASQSGIAIWRLHAEAEPHVSWPV